MFTSSGKNKFSDKLHGMLVSRHNTFDCKCTSDYSEIYNILGEQVHSLYFYGCKAISMEGFSIGNLKKLKPSTISME